MRRKVVNRLTSQTQMMMLCEKDTTSVQLQMFLQVQRNRVGKNYANGYSTTARLRQQIGWLRGSHDASKSSSAGNSRIMTAWSTWYGLRLKEKNAWAKATCKLALANWLLVLLKIFCGKFRIVVCCFSISKFLIDLCYTFLHVFFLFGCEFVA